MVEFVNEYERALLVKAIFHTKQHVVIAFYYEKAHY